MDFKDFWNLWTCLDFILFKDNIVTQHIQRWNYLDSFIGIFRKFLCIINKSLSWLNIGMHIILQSATNPIHGTFSMMLLVTEPANVNRCFRYWQYEKYIPRTEKITVHFSRTWLCFTLSKWMTFCRNDTDAILRWSDVSDVTVIIDSSLTYFRTTASRKNTKTGMSKVGLLNHPLLLVIVVLAIINVS